jgi:hypothetical protein
VTQAGDKNGGATTIISVSERRRLCGSRGWEARVLGRCYWPCLKLGALSPLSGLPVAPVAVLTALLRFTSTRGSLVCFQESSPRLDLHRYE